MLKILQARLQQYMNQNFQMYRLDLEKAEGPEIKLPPSELQKKHTSASLTTLKPLTAWITTNCGKILKRWDYQNPLTCFLRSLYAGQKATVRTRHATIDWVQIGKGVCQGYILSFCLFNAYVEYIMRNDKPDEAPGGFKIAGRNINNLRITDDTTLTEESEEEIKLLQEGERESKSWLKTQHSKN